MTTSDRSPRSGTGDVAPAAWAERLVDLGVAVRETVRAARQAGADFATPVAEEGGDTIFAIDRHVEPVLDRVIAGWPGACRPMLLVAEGCGADGRKWFPAANAAPDAALPGYRLIVDPIDGTRNIMYDKRSAWFIAAVAEDRGEATTLRDAFAAVMVELPTAKAGRADLFAATRTGPVTARRECLRTHERVDFTPRPSQATTLRNGFGHVTNFFPGAKVIAAQLMERIAEATLGEPTLNAATVFDDQYISTAGQMVELMVGHDRFCCDVRPLFYDAITREHGGERRGLECHPYDVAGLLVAERAGVIVTDGFGRPLDGPLDVHTGMHWCGYANAALRERIEPVVQAFLAERIVMPE